MRDVSRKQLEEAGERLRLLVANSYVMPGREELRVTISAGATLVADGDSVESIVKRVDRLLYASKRARRPGKNGGCGYVFCKVINRLRCSDGRGGARPG